MAKRKRRNNAKANVQKKAASNYAEIQPRGSFTERKMSREGTTRYSGADRNSVYLEELSSLLSGSADAEISYEIEDLRDMSADLCRNNPIANSIVSKKTLNIVGTGMMYKANVDADYLGLSEDEAKSLNDAIEREIRVFSFKKGACDIERESTLAQLCSIIQYSKLERGQVFVNFVYKKRPGERYGLKCQLIEADQVSNPSNLHDTPECSGGIQRAKDGEVVGFWFNPFGYRARSYADGNIDKWEFIRFFNAKGRRVASQIKKKNRPGQSTGVPDLTPVIESLAQLGRFNKEYLQKAVVAALLTILYKGEQYGTANPLGGIGANRGDPDGKGVKLGSGTSASVPSTDDIVVIESKTPGPSFDPFVTMFSKLISAGTGLPVEQVLGHFTSSYTAAQAALMEAWRYFLTERGDLISDFLDVMKELLFVEAISSGYLNLPGFNEDQLAAEAYMRGTWVGPPKGHLKPLEENKADKMAEEEGWTTPEQNAAKRGNDYTGKTYEKEDVSDE